MGKHWVWGIVCLALAATAYGQTFDPQMNPRRAETNASLLNEENSQEISLLIHLQETNGRPISKVASVRLSSPQIIPRAVSDTFDLRDARFRGILPGDYVVEVEVEGFQKTRKDVNVFRNGVTRCYIVLKRIGSDDEVSRPAGPPLSGKPRKELEAAITELKDNRLVPAWAHIEFALKHAPKHPDVHFIAAVYYLSAKDTAAARQHLEEAIRLFPDHTLARLSLGELLLRDGKPEDAIPVLERLVTIDPNFWRAHWLLAESLLRANRDASAAKFHAAKALSLGKEKAAVANGTLARAEAVLNPAAAPPAAATATVVPVFLKADQRSENFLSDVAPGEVPIALLSRWPSDIDAVVPAADPSVCVLPQVLDGVARRASEFADALEHFTAKEKIEQEEMDRTGMSKRSEKHSFDYSATLERYSPDAFSINEMRSGNIESPAILSIPVLAKGLPAMGVVFDANYSRDFQFACEGLGNWHGQPAWQVRFEQREDRPSRMYHWVVGKNRYPTLLKGRAWISTGSFHILRVETDLAKPIPEIRLEKDHVVIEYAAVKSASGKFELWLPASAEVHSQYRGRFIRERHEFSEFLLFSVDTIQNIAKPNERE